MCENWSIKMEHNVQKPVTEVDMDADYTYKSDYPLITEWPNGVAGCSKLETCVFSR